MSVSFTKKLHNFFAPRLKSFPPLHAVTRAEQEEQKILNITLISVYNSFMAFSLIPCQRHQPLWPLPLFICSPVVKSGQ